jgi:CYTH domain-containing protein
MAIEVELNDEQEYFENPSSLGEDVSPDLRYYNVNLAKALCTQW